LQPPPKNQCLPDSSTNSEDLPLVESSSDINVLKDFLSHILAQPDAMNDPAFFKLNISCTTTVQEIASRSLASKQAADAEDDGRMKQKLVSVAHNNVIDGQKKQQLVSVTHENVFDEHIDSKDYPTLQAKKILVESDKDTAAVLRDIIKLSKKVKSVDILEVVN
jgi:hypothetical protein